jgi:hypothetical protein
VRMPYGGWSGRWDSENWSYIAFTKEKIQQILERFDVEAIIKTWKERDWLDTDKKGAVKQVRIDRSRTYCYCLKKSVLEEVLKLKMDEADDA